MIGSDLRTVYQMELHVEGFVEPIENGSPEFMKPRELFLKRETSIVCYLKKWFQRGANELGDYEEGIRQAIEAITEDNAQELKGGDS